MVKPPLAWWRGQRILTDRHHNLEGIDPGGTECTPRSSLYNVEIKLPLKVRTLGSNLLYRLKEEFVRAVLLPFSFNPEA